MNLKNSIIIIICLILLAGLITLALFLLGKTTTPTLNNIRNNTAIKIIDGDTFELANQDTIRLLCVDTPEQGEEGYDEAINFLSSLILYQEVRLESSLDDKDSYGRLLRFVYVQDETGEEIFVNQEIISQEYGELFPYGNNSCSEIER